MNTFVLFAIITATAFAAVRTEGCSESAVRLQGLGSREVGRVQMCENGEWREMCSDRRWRDSNAVVVCRELGFSNGAVLTTADRLALSPGSSSNGNSSGSSQLITCSGLEKSLAECPTTQTDNNCQGPPPIVMCIERPGAGSVRLIHVDDKGSEFSGIVEVNVGEEWIGVCTDDWSMEDSGVVCRQLGYSTGTPIYTKPHASVIRRLPQQRLNYVHCSGGESSLLACNHTLYSSECHTANYASVNCSQDSISDEGTSEEECPDVSLDTIMSFAAVQLVVLGLAVLVNIVILMAWSRWRRQKVAQTTSSPGAAVFVSPPSYSDASRDTLLETGRVDTPTFTNQDTPTSQN